MNRRDIAGEIGVAANLNIKERNFWLDRLSAQFSKSHFPFDQNYNSKTIDQDQSHRDTLRFCWKDEIFSGLIRLRNNSDPRLHMILAAGLVILLHKYTGSNDILLGTPVYQVELQGEFINTVLVLRNPIYGNMIFKELLLQVRETIIQADENQDYPMEVLLENLNIPFNEEDDFPLFDVGMLLENIHDKQYIGHIRHNTLFSFHRTDASIEGTLEYNPLKYKRITAERIINHLTRLFRGALGKVNALIRDIDILSEEEKRQLLVDFNGPTMEYPKSMTIHQLFEQQREKTPDNIAVVGNREINGMMSYMSYMSYKKLNQKSNQLARLLRKKGVTRESVVGIMMEPSANMIASLLGILKAGGAYLPIDPGLPKDRILHMLEDSKANVLMTIRPLVEEISFTTFQDFNAGKKASIKVTPSRCHIKGFDGLPHPDRRYINFKNYKNKIGMASVTNCISLQSTRGCPYECLYCHKIWSKNHVYRSAENLYNEIEYYYKNGIRNFAFIDDCFNLNSVISRQLFQSIIKNRLKVQIFFPNGLRGDIMTPDFIDLMVEGGTRGINLSLETASPRLQQLLKKRLDLDKFKKVTDYIASEHPHVILELATMHGFPTETEEEAMMTLDFIKNIKWLHFPYIHILKIFPNTEMEAFALEHGVSKEDILASRDRAFHELPETLPFPKHFTREYQVNFLNNYFLDKERLKQVLPHQMKIVTQAALVQKYNAYLPVEIKTFEDIILFAQLADDDVQIPNSYSQEPGNQETIFDQGLVLQETKPGARKLLFLDLSQHFSSHHMLYNVVEQPLGILYLITHLKQQLGDQIDCRVYKSGNDFDSFEELKTLLLKYNPDLIGIRTLTFFKEFFHQTVSLIRQWGIDIPIITGGPYASSDYDTLLKDKNIDLVVLGEGEHTLVELVKEMLKNQGQLPGYDVLSSIPGIAYRAGQGTGAESPKSRDIILVDLVDETNDKMGKELGHPASISGGSNLAYVMYTSGSTGKPKGVMVEHCQVNNCISWMQDRFPLTGSDVVAHRTNLSFDPSVWEIFWPLYVGARVKVVDRYQSKDAEYLLTLMGETSDITVMYCPATLVNIMTHLLERKPVKPGLTLPLIIIGAESISMDVVKRFYTYFTGRIVNTYGPTEGTINNTYYQIQRDDLHSIIPIGKPVANNKLYILSEDLSLLPINVAGEICIAGESVARGYINHREKANQSFIKNPFAEGKLYKTGDIGRWLEDGTIEIMGRIDQQVKIRGYRIEPGEIESALLEHPLIEDCVVVPKTSQELQEEIRECKKCGIWSNYPGIAINTDNICSICENLAHYKKLIDQYFLTPEDLKIKIKEGNKKKKSQYDCLFVYACERVATYALYRLVEMGFNVLSATYDSGHYDQASLERIAAMAGEIGVDHIFLKHRRSDEILKESLRIANTMCKGCIHTSTALAGQYAYHHGIRFVIGETLSRGQIVENKLHKFIDMGVSDLEELEREISNLQAKTTEIDKSIFDIIGIDIVSSGEVYNQVEFIDFYRYCDATNQEMIKFLDEKNPYWKNLETSAIYSTDCKICRVGNFNHLRNKGYHYTGSAKSWDQRLGLTSLEDLKEDLKIDINEEEHAEFLNKLEYQEEKKPETNEKQLCAYIVPGEELSVSQLREHLTARLPDYMIPAYFIQLQGLPLTSNGKIDRKALPNPVLNPEEDYAAAGNELEQSLVEVWQETLGISRIGVNDNFFTRGGDSIKAIQIASRMNERGYTLEMRDIFLYPQISELAPHVQKTERIADQSIIRGTIPLTPIQAEFSRQGNTEPHHFNQAVMLYFREGFDEPAIRSTFKKIVQHHDALRSVFRNENNQVVQILQHQESSLSLQTYDFQNQEKTRAVKALESKADEIQRSINLETGPLMKLALFHLDDGDRLLIVIHHLVVDGISWRVLMEDIEHLYHVYSKDNRNEPPPLPLKTDSFKHWAERLSRFANSEIFLEQKAFWANLDAEATAIPQLQRDFEIETAYTRDSHTLSFQLSEENTNLLLTTVNEAFNTRGNDILLTALGLGFKKTFGMNRLVIALEGHGREEILEQVNVSRTVGWFTTVFPVVLDFSYEHDLSRQVKEIKETLRRIPDNGIGYGILKYLTLPQYKENLSLKAHPQINFNYWGQMDRTGEDNRQKLFEIARERPGISQSLGRKRLYDFEVSGMVVNNHLVISIAFSGKQYKGETVRKLLDAYKTQLERLVNYCSSREEKEPTPSDFTYKGLSIEQLHQLKNRYPYPIEDIYPLAPLQEGMLFHALYERDKSTYFEQMSFHFHGELEIDITKKSLSELLKRHDILRTVFVHENTDRPLQVVLKERQIDFFYIDLRKILESNVSENQKKRYLEELRNKDKQRSFDLSRDVMMRVTAILVNPCEYELIWSHHHILMDGWCISILISEFFAIYNALRQNKPYQLPIANPYRIFIQWLEKKDKKESKEFWKTYLDSYEEVVCIPRLHVFKPGNSPYRIESVSFLLDREKTINLNRLAAKNHLTVNTIVQAGWGILLGKYNRKQDVVFGTVVSGRPPEIQQVESMVGLFINTIPVRIRYEEKVKLSEMLKTVQQGTINSEPHHYYPLAEVQSLNRLKRNLLDHILVFENYPLNQQIDEIKQKSKKTSQGMKLELTGLELFSQTNYDLVVVVNPGERLSVKFNYNANAYDQDDIQRISLHYKQLLLRLPESENQSIDELTLLSEEEKRRILVEFNDTGTGYPAEKTIPRLFAEQAARTPDHIALLDQEEEWKGGRVEEMYLSYKELNKKSNQLADLLRKKGVKPNTIVPLMVGRSLQMIIGIMGILKAGGAYLPIAAETPKKRIFQVLEDTQVHLFCTQTNLLSQISYTSQQYSQRELTAPFLSRPRPQISNPDLLPIPDRSLVDGEIVLLDKLPPGEDRVGYKNPEPVNQPTDPVYTIFTSGSSGIPKGVLVQHQNLNNLLAGLNERIYKKYSQPLKMALVSPYVFDASVKQIFAALLLGHQLCIVPEKSRLDGVGLLEFFKKHRIEVTDGTPTHIRLLLDSGLKSIDNRILPLKHLLIGGEELSKPLVEEFLACFDNSPLVTNVYGPTECTVDAASYDIPAKNVSQQTIPIGKPMPNVNIFILDNNNQLQPIAVPGELSIAGAGVSSGYLNRPELTNEKFCLRRPGARFEKTAPGPYKNSSLYLLPVTRHPSPLYKTGDLARWWADGNIEFIGRIDSQVKIRGYRIELGEIENHLLEYPGIKQAVTLVNEDQNHKRYICAYIVSPDDVEVSVAELRKYLSGQLPGYMIPSHFIGLEEIPLTPAGKIDRNTLDLHGNELRIGTEYAAPHTDLERKIADIWKEVLGVEKVGIHDSFFDLGGDSLKVLRLSSKLNRAVDRAIPIASLFEYHTIGLFIKYLTQREFVSSQEEQESPRPYRSHAISKGKQMKSKQKAKRKQRN